ncbi:MAG: histidine phosphatase family protein, partial [Erysipelotrichaceae bacterium]|nr:histidine phosphatase family protein [Erysipelotrichaceae bacterium]
FEQTLRDIACDGEILIVSHGGVICHFLDRILDGWQGNPNTMVPNNSVTRVLYKNERFSVLEMPKTIVDLSI